MGKEKSDNKKNGRGREKNEWEKEREMGREIRDRVDFKFPSENCLRITNLLLLLFTLQKICELKYHGTLNKHMKLLPAALIFVMLQFFICIIMVWGLIALSPSVSKQLLQSIPNFLALYAVLKQPLALFALV